MSRKIHDVLRSLVVPVSMVAVLSVTVLSFYGCATTDAGPELTQASSNPKAPEVTFNHLDGTKSQITDYAGQQVVAVNFWGLRCQNCIEEMPFLERLYNKYGSKGFTILGVNTDGIDAKLLKRFLPQLPLKVSYPIILDTDFVLADSFQMMAAPLTVIIAKDGTIRYRHEGYEPELEGEIVGLIESLLAE